MASTKIGKFARHTPSWRIINVIPQNFPTAATPAARPYSPAIGAPEQSSEGRIWNMEGSEAASNMDTAGKAAAEARNWGPKLQLEQQFEAQCLRLASLQGG